METKIYTVDEVAEILRVSKRHVYEQVKQNKLFAIKIGHSVRISEVALKKYVEQGGAS